MKTKLFVLVAALALFATANSAADAATTAFTYSLNNTLTEDSGSGPSLVAYGGTLTSAGYFFGPNTGLSLSNAVNPNAYSIDIHFYFDDISASFNGYQRLIDFKNRATDVGLYSLNGTVDCFGCGGAAASASFVSGQFADLRVTRSVAGLFNVSVNGSSVLNIADSASFNTTFSGPNNIIYFFIDDFQTLLNYPPEAGSGRITFIEVSSDLSAVPLPAALPLFATGLGALGLLGWRRKRKASLSA